MRELVGKDTWSAEGVGVKDDPKELDGGSFGDFTDEDFSLE
jgi:hypothetical protein